MISAMFVATTLLPSPARQGSTIDVRSVLHQAVAAATRVKNIDSRDEVLTAIAQVELKAGMHEFAMRAAEQIKVSDRRAAVVAAVATKHYETSDWQSAGAALAWFLEESRSRHWYRARMQLDYSRASSTRPDGIGVNRALTMAARGEFTEARDMAMRIADRLSRYEALHGIAVAQLQFGDIDGAQSTIDRIPAKQPQLDRLRELRSNGLEFRSDGFRRIAIALADHGEFDDAFHTAGSIGVVRFRESALWSVAERQAASESTGVDADLLSRFPAIDNLSLFGLAVQARMKRSDEPGAHEVLCRAITMLPPLPEPAGRVSELIAAGISSAASAGSVAALREAQQVRDAFDRTSLLVGIARYLLDR